MCILYDNHGHNRIECFPDSDWAGCKEDRRSTSGYSFIGGNSVSWKSKKQNVISQSRAEAEYRAMAKSVCEVIWIYQLLSEVGIKVRYLQSYGVIIKLHFTLLPIRPSTME